MRLRFVHDHFRWDGGSRRLLLIDPPTLFFDDAPDRIAV